jgi:hypothetical protein
VKLNDFKIKQICESKLNYDQIAKNFDVSYSTVYRIKNNKYYIQKQLKYRGHQYPQNCFVCEKEIKREDRHDKLKIERKYIYTCCNCLFGRFEEWKIKLKRIYEGNKNV